MRSRQRIPSVNQFEPRRSANFEASIIFERGLLHFGRNPATALIYRPVTQEAANWGDLCMPTYFAGTQTNETSGDDLSERVTASVDLAAFKHAGMSLKDEM
jgi:hypothetical protein